MWILRKSLEYSISIIQRQSFQRQFRLDHLIVGTNQKTKVYIREFNRESDFDKLLGVETDNKLSFDCHAFDILMNYFLSCIIAP